MNQHNGWIAAGLVFAVGACSSTDDGKANDAMPAEIARFFEDFHASRYSQAAARASELDVAAQAHPEQGRLSFDGALAHNWHLQEFGRQPNPDGAALQAEQQSLPDLFKTAYENNPSDPRVGCFYGLQLVGGGRAMANDALIQQGIAVLDKAVQQWPEFNLFCLGLAYDKLPASHPDYAKAVKAALDNVDACVGESVDRAAPDIAKYVGQATSEGPKRACWNTWIAPHNAEGFYLWLGDLLVKQGNVAAARVAYNDVRLIAEYPTWPYRELLDDRLSANLDEKAALYQDADPANDPRFGGDEVNRRCAVCHAATADE
jgi:hypothetical protein